MKEKKRKGSKEKIREKETGQKDLLMCIKGTEFTKRQDTHRIADKMKKRRIESNIGINQIDRDGSMRTNRHDKINTKQKK